MESDELARRASRTLDRFLWGLGVVLLLWCALNWIYLVRANHVLLWDPVTKTPGVFAGLFGSWSFSLALTPPLACLQVLLVAGMTVLFGVLLLRILDVRLPWYAELAVAWPLGFGISGIAFELLTMAGWLYTLPSWLVWIALLGVAGYFARRRQVEKPWVELFGRHERPASREEFVKHSARVRPLLFHYTFEKYFWAASVALIVLITIPIFWHALFFPETYWDSLILYLGYGRMTFLEHAFPFKAEAQVGIGLGANYPHLYSNYGAMASTLFGSWSDLHQRFAAPLAGFSASVLVYLTTREIWRNDAIAAASMLLFRSVPLGIAYSTYASDYAFAVLFCALFVYAYVQFVKTRQPGAFILFTLVPAISMHLNYLMGILWVPWALGIGVYCWIVFPDDKVRKSLLRVAKSGLFWCVFAGALLLSSTWYVRNWALTGNPVYSFFPGIFTSSVRLNPEVLKSAELEWFRNGDGIGRVAELYVGRHELDSDEFHRRATVWHRLQASFPFWVGFESRAETRDGDIKLGSWFGRIGHLLQVADSEMAIEPEDEVFTWQHAYKMNPLFAAFLLPAVLALCFFPIVKEQDRASFREARAARTGAIWVGGALCLLLLAYMYLLADFYLYQIIGILAPACIIASGFLGFLRYLSDERKVLYRIALFIIVLQGVFPGLTFSLMNFKFFGRQEVLGQQFDALRLDAFRHPGMNPEIMQRLRFGADVDMWNYVNEHLQGERLLTHENRHYVLDPSITLIHLDDWDIQQLWGMPPDALRAELLSRGIRYYLRVPNENNHKILRRLGMEAVIARGGAVEVYTAGENRLYRLLE